MDAATVSVTASAAVALGTLAVTFIGGERERRQEAALDFERRVWEKKSEALLTVIELCRSFAEAPPITADNKLHYALTYSEMMNDLHHIQPVVDAFSSTECRTALSAFLSELKREGVAPGAGRRSRHFRDRAMEIPAEDFELKSYCMNQWKAADQAAVENFDLDLDAAQDRARAVLEAARESVRRSHD